MKAQLTSLKLLNVETSETIKMIMNIKLWEEDDLLYNWSCVGDSSGQQHPRGFHSDWLLTSQHTSLGKKLPQVLAAVCPDVCGGGCWQQLWDAVQHQGESVTGLPQRLSRCQRVNCPCYSIIPPAPTALQQAPTCNSLPGFVL